MGLPHFFIEERIGASVGEPVELALSRETCEHIRALRLKPRERAVFVDAVGHGWELVVDAVPERSRASIRGTLVREHVERDGVDLTLVQGISATDRMDQTIRQVTELGITRIIPLESERSIVRLNSASRRDKRRRWQRIGQSAAEQSGRLSLPVIEEPCDLAATLGMLAACDVLLFFWEEQGGRALGEALADALAGAEAGAPADALVDAGADSLTSAGAGALTSAGAGASSPRPRVALFVGPEGGFSAEEARRCADAGAETVTLGKTILRTETAAVVACALVLYHLGALGAR